MKTHLVLTAFLFVVFNLAGQTPIDSNHVAISDPYIVQHSPNLVKSRTPSFMKKIEYQKLPNLNAFIQYAEKQNLHFRLRAKENWDRMKQREAKQAEN